MDEKIKETLEKQLELLSERAGKSIETDELIAINHAINETIQLSVQISVLRGRENRWLRVAQSSTGQFVPHDIDGIRDGSLSSPTGPDRANHE